MSAGQVTKHCKFEIQCKRACAISTGKSHHTYNMFETQKHTKRKKNRKTGENNNWKQKKSACFVTPSVISKRNFQGGYF